MAPFNLHGLNVVQPVHLDTHDVAAPDFSAHLDLWTNLAFDSDEPLTSSKRKSPDNDHADPPNQDSHENAVVSPSDNVPLDISALLAGFGIDPLLIPTAPPAPIQQVPSLAHLLALHASPPSTSTASSPSVVPPSKRTRTQKPSSSTDNYTSPPQSPEEPTQFDPNSITLSATEDKRRRNTAASARFRLKKKEREAALERRAKELEDRVVELERECEGLRRENGWLKGLVVGVTGAGAAQHQQASTK